MIKNSKEILITNPRPAIMKRGPKLAIVAILVIAIIAVGIFIVYQPTPEKEYLWTHKDETAFYDYSSPALDDEGNLYVGTSHKWYHEANGYSLADHYYVYCLSQETGEEVWKYDAGPKEIRGGPVLGLNDMLYVVAEAHDNDGFRTTDELIALYQNNGTEAWSQVITQEIYRDPAQSSAPPYDQQSGWSLAILEPAIDEENNVYVAGEKFWSFYGNNGTLRWSYEAGARCSSCTVSRDLVLFAGRPMYAMNKDTGTVNWTYGDSTHRNYRASISGDGDIIFGRNGYNLTSLDREGNVNWEINLGTGPGGIRANPSIDNDGTIYVGTKNDDNSKLYAINPDGSIKWECTESFRDLYCSPALADDGNLYICSEDSKLFIIDMETGVLESEVNLERDVTWPSPVINSDGVLFVCDFAGYVYAYQTESTGLADVPWPTRAGSPERHGFSTS
ncbi:MAG: PQQ-binding-like beta-propeller repeat protein [Candidatus Lokiarchaeota archaeon]|nr:PQQ-binding-like beta-propeller repeat protein [Candidatus Lokiarchaeota archaeon]